jgi:hypothetical protein
VTLGRWAADAEGRPPSDGSEPLGARMLATALQRDRPTDSTPTIEGAGCVATWIVAAGGVVTFVLAVRPGVGFSVSTSDVSFTRTPPACSTNSTSTFRPSLIRYSMVLWSTIRVYVRSTSKPLAAVFGFHARQELPAFAQIAVLRVVCQSSWAVFHCLVSAGLFQASQSLFSSAFATVSTVIFMGVSFLLQSGCS